ISNHIHLRWSPVIPSLITTVIVSQSWVVSFKVALISTLKATIALLIIVVVVTVVIVVVVTVVVVVVVVVTVVVGVVVVVTVVVVVSRPYPTVPGQMANPIAVITPRLGLCSASYSVGFYCSWKDHHSLFSFLPDVQHRHESSPPSTQL
ncbi:hypothetical protein Tco_0311235, partial [Tanacetum coccineum]